MKIVYSQFTSRMSSVLKICMKSPGLRVSLNEVHPTLNLSMFDVRSRNFHGNINLHNECSTLLCNFDLFIANRRVNLEIRFKSTKSYTQVT